MPLGALRETGGSLLADRLEAPPEGRVVREQEPQPLELGQAAERGVRDDPAVQLQAADPLGDRAERALEGARLEAALAA